MPFIHMIGVNIEAERLQNATPTDAEYGVLT